jgi:hypothetical protein
MTPTEIRTCIAIGTAIGMVVALLSALFILANG